MALVDYLPDWLKPKPTEPVAPPAPNAGGRRRHRTRHRKSKSKRRRTGRKSNHL